MLYVNLISVNREYYPCLFYANSIVKVAQRHGLFSATEGQLLDKSMFENITDNVLRWKAWSKVESVKRFVV